MSSRFAYSLGAVLLLFGTSLLAMSMAEMYSYTDENGVVHIVNAPQEDSRYAPTGQNPEVKPFIPVTAPVPPALSQTNGTKTHYVNEPLDVFSEHLPAGFHGADAVELTRRIIRSLPKKTEFESTAAYNVRLREWEAKPLLGSIKPESVIAIALLPKDDYDPLTIRYDADSQNWTITIFSFLCHVGPGTLIARTSHKSGGYVGSNAFGVKRHVSIINETVLCLDGLPVDMVVKVPMTPDVARTVKHQLRVAVVAKLVAPYVTQDMTGSTATIDAPVDLSSTVLKLTVSNADLMVYNGSTGDIYLRPRRH